MADTAVSAAERLDIARRLQHHFFAFLGGNSPAAAGKLPNDYETSAVWPLSIGYTLKPGCVANALLRILLAICRPSVFSADVVRAPSTPYQAVNPASYVQAPW